MRARGKENHTRQSISYFFLLHFIIVFEKKKKKKKRLKTADTKKDFALGRVHYGENSIVCILSACNIHVHATRGDITLLLLALSYMCV